MHYTALASLALLIGPLAVSAQGTLGFALGSKRGNGECKDQSDYLEDFKAIYENSGSRIVRGYSTSQCDFVKHILPAAKAMDFKVVLGMWPDTEESFNLDKAALQDALPFQQQVHAITVGSETLYRGNFTGEELQGLVSQVKEILPDVKVGTADSWNKYADGTADALVRSGVDILFINAFSYWQGKTIEDAPYTFFDDIKQAFERIQETAGSVDSIQLAVGETGWPTDGGHTYGDAVASTENAKKYFHTAICPMLSWGVDVFVFEAFDEPWKPASIGMNGEAADETHWGVMTVDRKLKPQYSLVCGGS